MKRYADLLKNNEYKRINIWDIYNQYHKEIKNHNEISLEQYYTKNFDGCLYSTHKHKANKKPMKLIIRKKFKNSYFEYVEVKNNEPPESTSHKNYKDIINQLNQLNLKIGNDIIKIYVEDSQIEYEFVANNNTYKADVFIWFNKSYPEDYVRKWNGKLCFEIKFSNSVTEQKIYDCNKEGIPIFEHKISPKLSINDSLNDKEKSRRTKFIKDKYLSKEIYGELLSDPETPEYLKIKDLENKNSNLEEQILILQKENDKLTKLKNKILKHKVLNFLFKIRINR